MINTLNEIFKLIKIPKLLGYILILIILFLTFLGSVYIKDKVERDFNRDKLIKEREYNEKKDNEKEIRRIMNEIDTELYLYLDWPFDSPGAPKVSLEKLRDKLDKVIEENTYNFSENLYASLIQIRHFLNSTILIDKVLDGITGDDLVKNPRIYVENIEIIKKSKSFHDYPIWKEKVYSELDNIKYE